MTDEIVGYLHIKQFLDSGELEQTEDGYYMSPDKKVWYANYQKTETRVSDDFEFPVSNKPKGAKAKSKKRRRPSTKDGMNALVRKTKGN